LEQSVQDNENYDRRTLFPDKRVQDINGRAMVRGLRGFLDELKPNVVCINGWSDGGSVAALGWCVANRVPAIIMSESTAHDHQRRQWKEEIKRRIVGLCSASLVGGSAHRDHIAELGASPDNVFMGYDAVDNDHFRKGAERARRAESSLRQELSLPPAYFMACSRFEAKKNLPGLLRGYARYRELASGRPWSLVVVGDGGLKEELFALRHRLGLEGHVLFPGAKNYQELPSYYGLAGAFVHASTTEQWGLVINEAMAAGLPVLVSKRCGCAPDLVVPGSNGLLFDPDDVNSIASAMVEIADGSDGLRAMGRNSQTIVGRWSPARFAESLNEAVDAAMRRPVPLPGLIDRLLLWMLQER
jgi:glycosyltransferase involved in cell wall biosynthesis